MHYIDIEYTVYLLPAAYDRMVSHTLFLAQVSISAAERLYKRRYKEIKSLDFNAAGYPVYLPRKKIYCTGTIYRYTLCKKLHRIVFVVIDDAVYVYDVQDCRQHPNRSLV